MYRERFQKIRFVAIIFHKLGRQFDKIPFHRRSRQVWVGGICQNSVECVPEFMEKCGDFLKCEQTWHIAHWFRKITNDRNMWAVISSVFLKLASVARHPGACAFSGTREIVGVE